MEDRRTTIIAATIVMAIMILAAIIVIFFRKEPFELVDCSEDGTQYIFDKNERFLGTIECNLGQPKYIERVYYETVDEEYGTFTFVSHKYPTETGDMWYDLDGYTAYLYIGEKKNADSLDRPVRYFYYNPDIYNVDFDYGVESLNGIIMTETTREALFYDANNDINILEKIEIINLDGFDYHVFIYSYADTHEPFNATVYRRTKDDEGRVLIDEEFIFNDSITTFKQLIASTNDMNPDSITTRVYDTKYSRPSKITVEYDGLSMTSSYDVYQKGNLITKYTFAKLLEE